MTCGSVPQPRLETLALCLPLLHLFPCVRYPTHPDLREQHQLQRHLYSSATAALRGSTTLEGRRSLMSNTHIHDLKSPCCADCDGRTRTGACGRATKESRRVLCDYLPKQLPTHTQKLRHTHSYPPPSHLTPPPDIIPLLPPYHNFLRVA